MSIGGNFMKKLLAIVLAAVCVLSFSACDSDNSSSESSTTTSTTTTTTEPTTTTTTEPTIPNTEKVVIDYSDAESFEAALNAGKNLENKTVQFVADELHPNSAFGYDIWAGEHLNFVSSQNPDVDAGDTVVVKVTEINSTLGSWIIYYEKLDVIKADSSTVATTKKKTTTTTRKKTTTTTTTTKPETNTVIFENNGIKITYKGLDFNSSIFGPEIKLLIENNSSKSYTVQVRDFSIDGYMISTSCSVDVTAGNKTNDGITIMSNSLEENGLDEHSIKKAQFYFHIFNSDDWSDSFDTVVINLEL